MGSSGNRPRDRSSVSLCRCTGYQRRTPGERGRWPRRVLCKDKTQRRGSRPILLVSPGDLAPRTFSRNALL